MFSILKQNILIIIVDDFRFPLLFHYYLVEYDYDIPFKAVMLVAHSKSLWSWCVNCAFSITTE